MALNAADIQEKLLKIAESIRESGPFKGLKSFFGNLLKKIPENRRVPVLAAGGGCVLLVICLVVVAASGNRRGRSRVGESVPAVSGPRIPAEDLFYPAEPDFLPGLLLEREPRQGWTADDAAPFWRDPAGSAELSAQLPADFWREKMSETIDKLMESVP
ncbi:hypothetical protein [Leadbettera azotonutricia]|uniref:Uncharacterized protein n=1 Tax=Leadbettera azotonutricia (strain ATCC BAA-888 / DSM 13862 / ZAS-9) TaxID=545695 RepID=F5YDS4_LEAAZ|nr:hypothetical protein [Leadbettera azotonutricia]AEF80627.1 hypothetical protein TREAZ_2690 [Leadbettera azotonutricia ZAS-9]